MHFSLQLADFAHTLFILNLFLKSLAKSIFVPNSTHNMLQNQIILKLTDENKIFPKLH